MTILKNSNRYTALGWLTLVAFILLGLSMAIISGCTDTLKGDAEANKAPVVYFVNIPPDDTKFSHNPEIYWFGSDVDGQIVYYRYVVATSADIVGCDTCAVDKEQARQWAAGLDDQAWHYVDVDPSLSDPQTARVIPLTADPLNPVSEYVEQFVFLQAFDDDNLGSVIAVKSLSRNDHPPETDLYNSWKNDSPYVNAVTAGGIITGVSLTWSGSDKTDYDEQGLVAPPFEYEWNIYGPFDSTEIAALRTIDTTTYTDSTSEPGLVRPTWFDNEGKQYFVGDELTIVDSFLVGEGDDRHWELWDTLIVFSNAVATDDLLGIRRDLLINLDAKMIADKLVETSNDGYDSWVSDTTDVFYNLFRNAASSDVTITKHFLFAVRARDDALVPDPTPAFCTVPVIDPRHERGVLVIDFTNPNSPLYNIHLDSSQHPLRRALFGDLINEWNSSLPFDPAGDNSTVTADYLFAGNAYSPELVIPLSKVLQYKIMIWYSDHTVLSNLKIEDGMRNSNLLKAIDAGINVWAMGRGMFIGGTQKEATHVGTEKEREYFGIESIFFSGWLYFHRLIITDPDPVSIRIEDFIGAYSVDESKWPNLDIDPNLLRDRYFWPEDYQGSVYLPPCPFDPDIAALPEVNWCGRRYGTEVMYLYKSLYGANHFLGFPYAIEGAPCGHRLETDLYRTVFTMFPLWPLKEAQAQELANSVLDWLYEPWLDR